MVAIHSFSEHGRAFRVAHLRLKKPDSEGILLFSTTLSYKNMLCGGKWIASQETSICFLVLPLNFNDFRILASLTGSRIAEMHRHWARSFSPFVEPVLLCAMISL